MAYLRLLHIAGEILRETILTLNDIKKQLHSVLRLRCRLHLD